MQVNIKHRVDDVQCYSHSRRRRMSLKINDLSHMAFVNIKSMKSTTYAFYAARNTSVFC